MCQIHSTARHIAFCVFDAGIGIYQSLKSSNNPPNNPELAIISSIEEGVTRDRAIGQGNGLWGMHQMVTGNQGLLTITSDSASCVFEKGTEYEMHPMHTLAGHVQFKCTTVDFQLDVSKEIQLPWPSVKPFQTRIEIQETEQGEIEMRIADRSSGTGTRQAGMNLRNELLNIIAETNNPVTLNFDGVRVISSSYADELFGKLINEIGVSKFMQFVKITNCNDFISDVINRSVTQRIKSQ